LEITAWADGVASVRVTSPPVDDAANEACGELLARALGVRASDVEIVGGRRSRNKIVAVAGVPVDEIAARLQAAVSKAFK
jgi:uncharacterized protein YggU (UPF0235/DUF167 family)